MNYPDKHESSHVVVDTHAHSRTKKRLQRWNSFEKQINIFCSTKIVYQISSTNDVSYCLRCVYSSYEVGPSSMGFDCVAFGDNSSFLIRKYAE